MSAPRWPSPRVGAAAAVLAALAWSSFLLSAWLGPDGLSTTGFVSELATAGRPDAAVFRASDLVAGLALLVVAAALRAVLPASRRGRAGVLLVAATGLSGVVDFLSGMSCAGAAPGQCADSARTVGGMLGALADVHTLSAVLEFAGTGAGPVLVGSALGLAGRPAWGWPSVAAGVVSAGCGLLDLVLLLAGVDVGPLERVRTVVTSLWFLGLAVLLVGAARPVSAAGTRTGGRV